MTGRAARRNRRLLGAVVLLIGGCAVPLPVPDPVAVTDPEPAAQVPPEPEPPFDEEALYALLDAAERALADDRLLTPESDSALFYYKQAVALAPDHELAQEGFERIVERYLALATRAIERERWASARSMLDRARLVDADHVGIGALRRQVELLSNARRVVLDLSQAEVRNRRLGTMAKLTAFGLLARDPAARVTIRAGSDADGRWMYEQLNKVPGAPRIRGGIVIGIPPKVTILFLAESE